MASAVILSLYDKAMQAEKAWQAALVATYGSEACNARYDNRGTATPELAALHTAKRKALDVYRMAAWPHARAA